MHGYDHHIGDYTRDTVGLSMAEDGAYRRLLDQCYARELPLPADKREIYSVARARTAAERRAVDHVLERYFVLRDDGYHNPRADKEIGQFHRKSEKARIAAEERWAREREREANKFGRRASDQPSNDAANAMPTQSERIANADANAMRTHDQKPVDNHANAMPPASARAHTRAGAAFRLPSSDFHNRGSVVTQPSEVRSGAPPPQTAQPAVEKTGPRKANGKGDGRGQQWSSMAYVHATAQTLGMRRRENEDDDSFKDRVYSAVQERVAAR